MGTVLDLGRERVATRVTLLSTLSTLASERLVKRTTVTLDDEGDWNADSLTDAGRNRARETRSGVVDDPRRCSSGAAGRNWRHWAAIRTTTAGEAGADRAPASPGRASSVSSKAVYRPARAVDGPVRTGREIA